MRELIEGYGDAAVTSVGFFWKAGWAFVLGYLVSACIQVFVPRRKLAQHMGDATPRSIGLATTFGAISSSCSFAALAAAREVDVPHYMLTGEVLLHQGAELPLLPHIDAQSGRPRQPLHRAQKDGPEGHRVAVCF
jgi:hypothetical protein